jgi:hypothetical protein
VFVTGNAGKLKEVREILAGGPQQPIEVESQEVDSQSGGRPSAYPHQTFFRIIDFEKKNSTRDTGHDARNS